MSRMIVLSGADETVPIRKLRKLQDRYPQVRYGVLYNQSLNPKPKPRYPSFAWIRALHGAGVKLDVHLCGAAVTDHAHKTSLFEVLTYAERVQWNIGHLKEMSDDHASHIDDVSGSRPVIIQVSESVNPYYKVKGARTKGQTLIFHDASRGNGVLPELYPSAVSMGLNIATGMSVPMCTPTGYGGGLAPINLATEIPKIIVAATGGSYTWIDVETGLRTVYKDADKNVHIDEFNFDKAEAFVENAVLHGW